MDGLKNAAYSKEYMRMNSEYDALFIEANKKEEEVLTISEKYSLRKALYRGTVNSHELSARLCRLFDKQAMLLHEWKNYDSDADFETLVAHSNGNTYLVYRKELYGYSVYDFANDKEFSYFPQCVLEGKEYFIWTAVFYNPVNSILAVQGCFWACPWSTLLVDFSDPMREPLFQVDVSSYIEGSYNDADFVSWKGENLVLKLVGNSSREVTIPPEQYRKWVELGTKG